MERNANTHPLTKALAAIGWSQGRLAVESGVAQSTISFAVRGLRGGKFSAESARKILGTIERETERQKNVEIRKAIGKLKTPAPIEIPEWLTPARALRIEHLIFPHPSPPKRTRAAA